MVESMAVVVVVLTTVLLHQTHRVLELKVL
jgi:hypothetical protein